MNASSTWVPVGGACGVVFAILLLITIFAGGPPPGIGASGKDVVAYYGGSGARVSYISGAALPTLFAPWFFTTLTLLFWQRTSDRAYAAIGLVAITVTGTLATAGNVIVWGPLVYGSVNEATAHTFNVALYTLHAGIAVIILSATLAYGIVQARLPGLWRWVGYFAFLVVLLEAITFLASLGNSSSGIVGLFGFLAFVLWAGFSAVLQVWRGSDLET